MHCCRASTRLLRRARLIPSLKCTFTSYNLVKEKASRISKLDIIAAREYCDDLLENFDNPAYVLQTFISRPALDAYLSIRAFNVELTRIPDLVSNPTIGALRMQFWRDNINQTFADNPPHEPVAILLHHALGLLKDHHPHIYRSSFPILKKWFMKIIAEREKYMDNRPFPTLAALETYAENTYSTLLYLTLAFLPLHSVAADHMASHIGKASGIAAILRGIPLVAFPSAANSHSNNSAFNGALGGNVGGGRHGAVMLPLDIMAETGVKEEEVYRHGAEAEGLKDAVFKVATRANDHLITMKNIYYSIPWEDRVVHAYEHEGEDGHDYDDASVLRRNIKLESTGGWSKRRIQALDVWRAFGALMPFVSTRLWLGKLEKYDFDVFRPELREKDWRLPWKAYRTFKTKRI